MNTEKDKIDFLYKNFKKIYKDVNEDNWQLSIKTFLQKIIDVNYDIQKDRIASGWLASLCEKAYYCFSYEKSKKKRNEFQETILSIFNSVDIPSFLRSPGNVLCGKRQPSFLDTIKPTLDRYETIEEMVKIFRAGLEGLIIGGSMSYGSFYSVRHNVVGKDYSDIDGLVIFNDDFFKNRKFDNDLFLKRDTDIFFKRLGRYNEMYKKKEVDTISQRFSLKKQKYTVSLHFIPLVVFEDMVYKKLNKDVNNIKSEFTIRDYRVDNFNHPCFARHTFNGDRYESVIKSVKVKEGDYISYVPGYTIDNHKFFPGIFQTVILPHFLVYEDKHGLISPLVNKFESIVYKEVEKMKIKFPEASYAFAHNRYDIFVPGRYDNGLNTFINPTEKGDNYSAHKECVELDGWKKNVLDKAEQDIEVFLKDRNSEKILQKYKEDGLDWFSVCFINAKKDVLNEVKYKNKLKFEVCRNLILPKELMKLEGYEKLSMKYGKVFIASIYDPANYRDKEVIYYSVIIKTR